MAHRLRPVGLLCRRAGIAGRCTTARRVAMLIVHLAAEAYQQCKEGNAEENKAADEAQETTTDEQEIYHALIHHTTSE